MSELRHPKLLTLTIRNASDLTSDEVARFRHYMKTLLRRIQYFVRGGIYAIEIENIGNGWHIHAHIVMDAVYIPQQLLSDQWRAITGDSFIVDIRRAWSPRSALSYILKYLTKEPKLLDEFKPLYNLALKGVRLIHPFGVLYRQWKAERVPFPCPGCGGTMWRVEVVSVIWLPVELLTPALTQPP